jgi:hypothetical protein
MLKMTISSNSPGEGDAFNRLALRSSLAAKPAFIGTARAVGYGGLSPIASTSRTRINCWTDPCAMRWIWPSIFLLTSLRLLGLQQKNIQ